MMLPMRVGPFAFRYQGNGATPSQYLDDTRKAIDCATTLPLSFWATVCKTVRPKLSVRCLSVLSVCNVGVLWPNGWTDQDETWLAGRPRPWPHCVSWGPRFTSPKGAQTPHFRPISGCGQMAAWIKMSLGMEVGLGPGDFVLDGDPAPPPKKGGRAAPQFSAHVYCGQTAGWMKLVLGMEVGLSPATLC